MNQQLRLPWQAGERLEDFKNISIRSKYKHILEERQN